MTLKKCIIFFVFFCCFTRTSEDEDLYKVLGVKKTATSQDIKKAYKSLAREWHPDKNKDPQANEKFMKINEAYETLSDAERRSEYDNFGRTSSSPGQGNRHNGFHSPFDSFFSDGGFQFNFGGGQKQESSVEKYRITLRSYEHKVLEESHQKPYLIYAYTDFCYQCMQVEMIWDRIVMDMETIGMGAGTLHAQFEAGLSHKLKINTVPSMFIVIAGKPYRYTGEIRLQRIRDFIRSLLPKNLVTEVTDQNYKRFLESWTDNKVRMLFFGDRKDPTLRYSMTAYANRDRIVAGYINIPGREAQRMIDIHRVQTSSESLLMFNEETTFPMAHVSMKQLTRNTMDDVIETNQYLALPRLSSHKIFNDLCPAASSRKKKQLCVVLLSQSIPEHDSYRDSFRKYVLQRRQEPRVKYTYVYEDTQASFVKGLTLGQGPVNVTSGSLKVAVLWRVTEKRLQYDWLEEGWRGEGETWTRNKRQLSQLVSMHLESAEIMPYILELSNDLVDEHAAALHLRMIQKLLDWGDLFYDKMTSLDEMTLLTVGTALAFIVIMSLMMRSLVNIEDKRMDRPKKKKTPRPAYTDTGRPTVYVHPLCQENFQQLITDAEPGVRLIVILVNQASKTKLLEHFAMSVHAYSRSDAFKFAFLQLETYVNWYRHVLEQTLDFKRDLTGININNCIGTVMAINGPRKYYCIYHAQNEMRRKNQRDRSGDFVGFDDSDSESEPEAKKLFEADLLGTFGMWMDRLCEGSQQRLRVEYWPDIVDF